MSPTILCPLTSRTDRRRDRSDAGIALVFISGILSLLVFLGAAIVQTARLVRDDAANRSLGIQAHLSALDGMEYAAARLERAPRPDRSPMIASRGDSWIAREAPGTPVSGMSNPSYSHGEPWRDDAPLPADGRDNDGDGAADEPDEGAGLYTPGEGFLDRDGNGRLSACSGRTRGDGPMAGADFTLAISSWDAGIPVNAGILSTQNRYGNKSYPYGPNFVAGVPVPDHRDPDIACHKGLVHALNNLGVVCGIVARRWDAPAGYILPGGTPGESIQCSWLGNDLIRNRPAGGYRDWDQISATLLALPFPPGEGPPYTSEDLAKVKPYIDIDSANGLSGESGFTGFEAGEYPACAPIALATAPEAVLASLFMYVSAFPHTDLYPRETGTEYAISTRTGPRSSPDSLHLMPATGLEAKMIIFPDEATALAKRLISLRDVPPRTWRQIYAALLQESLTLFPRDVDDIDHSGPAQDTAAPVFARHWTQAKADMAFQAVTPDPVFMRWPSIYMPPPAIGHPATWIGWGIDRDGDPANGVQQQALVHRGSLERISYPPAPGAPWPWSGGGGGMQPYLKSSGEAFQPLTLTLAPPDRFQVDSLGRAAGKNPGSASTTIFSGTLHAGESLKLASQADFESLTGGSTRLASAGIQVVQDLTPAQFHDTRAEPDHPTRPYPHIATLPDWDRRSWTAAEEGPPCYGFSRGSGAVALATKESDVGSARIYWTFPLDFDGAPTGEILSEGPAGAFPLPFLGPGFTSEDPVTPFRTNPYHARALSSTVPVFPPFSGPFQPATVSAWMSCAGSLQWSPADPTGPHGRVLISTWRGWQTGDPTRPGTRFSVNVSWAPVPASSPVVTSQEYLVEDAEAFQPHTPWSHHVALVFDHDGAGMKCTLFVDGRMSYPSTGDMVMTPPPLHQSGTRLAVQGTGIDELRFLDGALDATTIGALHAEGRIVRSGQYASPVYVFDAPTRLAEAQWTGHIPPGIPGDPITVTVEAYSTIPGEPGHPTLAWSRVLHPASQGPEDLSGLPACRSFRYRVLIDCWTCIGPLLDTPVFEALDLMLRRNGRSSQWTAWKE